MTRAPWLTLPDAGKGTDYPCSGGAECRPRLPLVPLNLLLLRRNPSIAPESQRPPLAILKLAFHRSL